MDTIGDQTIAEVESWLRGEQERPSRDVIIQALHEYVCRWAEADASGMDVLASVALNHVSRLTHSLRA